MTFKNKSAVAPTSYVSNAGVKLARAGRLAAGSIVDGCEESHDGNVIGHKSGRFFTPSDIHPNV